MCIAFLFLVTSHFVRLRRASVPRSRLLAAVATLDLPVPTGVPKSITGRLALTWSPKAARLLLALLAAFVVGSNYGLQRAMCEGPICELFEDL